MSRMKTKTEADMSLGFGATAFIGSCSPLTGRARPDVMNNRRTILPTLSIRNQEGKNKYIGT